MRPRTIPCDVVPPEWVVPSDEPSTGWLSPDGALYPCAPWMHEEMAVDLVAHHRRTHPSEPHVDCGEQILCAGWLKVGRKNHAIRASTGGLLVIYGTHDPTEAQADVLLRWMHAGAQVEDGPPLTSPLAPRSPP